MKESNERHVIMRRFSLRKLLQVGDKGQSLVEMAIIIPLLIFMMIGVFEVGWAIRSYLVLVNINREITRFAVRPGYMDFSTEDSIKESYEEVQKWSASSVSDQLNLTYTGSTSNTTLIISHVVVDTGLPCQDIESCNCNKLDPDNAAYDPDYNFKDDDIIIHPALINYEYQQQRFGPASTVTGSKQSRIQFEDLAKDLEAQNNYFNCQILKNGGVSSSNNVIATEMFFDLPQLFGFPLISNPFTDPLPLYTHTTMRLIGAARSTGTVSGNITSNIDAIGPICLAFPMVVDDSAIANPSSQNIIANGWLKWGDNYNDDKEYVTQALKYPQMSLNDFDEGRTGGVKKGSLVDKVTFTISSLEDEDTEIKKIAQGLKGQKIIIPYSTDLSSGSVIVTGFVWATIQDVDLPNNKIMAVLDNDETTLPPPCVSKF